MANWTALKAAIAAVIKTNGKKEITGAVLQSTLNTIVSNLGENATFKGVAYPDTIPGYNDGQVFYIASKPGIYVNFGGINFVNLGLYILKYIPGSGWDYENLSYVITEATQIINNPDEEDITVSSGQLKLRNRNNYKIIRADFNWSSDLSSYKNSILEIRYKHDCGGNNIVLPNNVTLLFTGGKLLNANNITGTNTKIISDLNHIFDNINSFDGTFIVNNAFPEWFGAIGDGINDDTIYINSVIKSNISKNIILSHKYLCSNAIKINNINYLNITGNGDIYYFGDNYLFELIGLCNKISINNLRLWNKSLSNNSICAIGCNSGQTISNTSFSNLYIENFNIGITHNADLAGSWNNGICHNNIFKNIKGTKAGFGYGIHTGNAFNISIYQNTFDNCERHSIYISKGEQCNCIIDSNIIINHRKNVYDENIRPAIDIIRSSGVICINNILKDCYGTAIEVSHDSSLKLNCNNILISNNQIINPLENVPVIHIGESLIPTNYHTYNIDVVNNKITCDSQKRTGSIIIIRNGKEINIKNNILYVNHSNLALPIFVELGDNRYINSDSHIKNIKITDNICNGDSDILIANSKLIYVCSQLCIGSSTYHIEKNISTNWETIIYFYKSPTNQNSKFEFKKTLTTPLGAINSGSYLIRDIAFPGVKPTSNISGTTEGLDGSIIYTFFTANNSIRIQVNNISGTQKILESTVFTIKIND